MSRLYIGYGVLIKQFVDNAVRCDKVMDDGWNIWSLLGSFAICPNIYNFFFLVGLCAMYMCYMMIFIYNNVLALIITSYYFYSDHS